MQLQWTLTESSLPTSAVEKENVSGNVSRGEFDMADWAGPNADPDIMTYLTEKLKHAHQEKNCFAPLGNPLSKASEGHRWL